MKYALVNPNWNFDGSIYFGCREPHLPLEYGYAEALLQKNGHEVLLVDAHMEGLTLRQVKGRVASFEPDFVVITTAPGYLFWRCAPPELRTPKEAVLNLRDLGGKVVVVGPHASTTPGITMRKLDADIAVMGEFEEILPALAGDLENNWRNTPSICLLEKDGVRIQGRPHAADLTNLPALRWTAAMLDRHPHHHHRFDDIPTGPGAELESSRGCPFHCSFCAKENFRNTYRRRPTSVVFAELDHLIDLGVEYVYFIDELFLPKVPLLQGLRQRAVKFGVQLRIDLWNHEMLELLGSAGCVSIEAGVESITDQGRRLMAKRSKLELDEITHRLIAAKRHIPFVQANLVDVHTDDPDAVQTWRQKLLRHGVWANEPVPLFPYPGSPLYKELWGEPDDQAWERAHDHYLETYSHFSDIQEQKPMPLAQLESGLRE
jgi:anaerobic magnesium-protoporphyrin IX monomethyl ester cyclase